MRTTLVLHQLLFFLKWIHWHSIKTSVEDSDVLEIGGQVLASVFNYCELYHRRLPVLALSRDLTSWTSDMAGPYFKKLAIWVIEACFMLMRKWPPSFICQHTWQIEERIGSLVHRVHWTLINHSCLISPSLSLCYVWSPKSDQRLFAGQYRCDQRACWSTRPSSSVSCKIRGKNLTPTFNSCLEFSHLSLVPIIWAHHTNEQLLDCSEFSMHILIPDPTPR
jgi:hypothetical protein